MRVYGCTVDELEKFTLAERQAFLQQKTNVRRSDVSWRLTLAQWSSVWVQSGKWSQRGRGPFKYGLCRIDSSGAFSVENVLILKNNRSARLQLKLANHLPDLEVRREAWILARLEAAWAESGRARKTVAGDIVPSSTHRKYWERVGSAERERLESADTRRK